MATTHAGARKTNRYRIAPLTPDSPDPDARADATNPALLAALEEARRRAREPGGRLSQEEIEAKDELALRKRQRPRPCRLRGKRSA
jgi:hypothetical protein